MLGAGKKGKLSENSTAGVRVRGMCVTRHSEAASHVIEINCVKFIFSQFFNFACEGTAFLCLWFKILGKFLAILTFMSGFQDFKFSKCKKNENEDILF